MIDEARFRIRLVGSASVAAVGRDYTGKYLDESMSGDVLSAALARYRAAITARRPVLSYAEYILPDGAEVTNLMMTLPLATGGRSVDRLMGIYAPMSDWLARQALRNLDTAPYVKVKRWQVVL